MISPGKIYMSSMADIISNIAYIHNAYMNELLCTTELKR